MNINGYEIYEKTVVCDNGIGYPHSLWNASYWPYTYHFAPSLVTIPLFLFLFLTTNIIPIVNNNIPYKREIRMKKKEKKRKKNEQIKSINF